MKHTIEDVKLTIEPEFRMLHNRIGVFNSHFQNFKNFGIPKAQLIIADVPYNLSSNAYASNPSWYIGGDNKNGESGLRVLSFSTPTRISVLLSSCTFARKCLGLSQRRKARHLV